MPNVLKRTFAHTNANIDIDGVDDNRVDVDVAVFDNGVDLSHPDLNIVRGIDCVKPPNYVCESNSPDDGQAGNPHGTWAALDLGAIDNGIGSVGVAPGARIWAVKTVPDAAMEAYAAGQTATLDMQAFLAAINLVVAARRDNNPANDMEVVLAGGWPGCPSTERTRIVCPGGPTGAVSVAIREAISDAVDEGVTVIAGAGNWNEELDQYGAGYDDILAVTAMADTDGLPGSLGPDGKICRAGDIRPEGTATVKDDTRNPFSGWGVRADLAAPGGCTSTSLALAGGGAALLASAIHPDSRTDVEDIRGTLRSAGNYDWTDTLSDGEEEPEPDAENDVQEPLLDVGDEDVFEPILEPQFDQFQQSSNWTYPWSLDYTFQLADVNGDGRADAVGRGTIADVQVGLSTGTSFATSNNWTYPWSHAYSFQLADVNGDGRADAVGHNPTTNDVQVGLSTGTSFAPSTGWATWGWTPESSSYTFQLADVNGDGRADAVGRGTIADVQVGLSTGTSFATSNNWTYPWSHAYSFQLADVNGDGRADAVGHNPTTNDVQVGLSTGTSFAPSTGWTSWSSSYTFQLADVNDDGRADAIGRHASGDVQVGLSNGSSLSQSSSWTSAWPSGYSLELADANGDGSADLVGRGAIADVHVGLAGK